MKPIRLTWLSPASSFNVEFSGPLLVPHERQEIEKLAANSDFIVRPTGIWTYTGQAKSITDFEAAARREGFSIQWEDKT